MRYGSSPFITEDHTCRWYNGANGDPTAGFMCLHGYKPDSGQKLVSKPGAQQTYRSTIYVGRGTRDG